MFTDISRFFVVVVVAVLLCSALTFGANVNVFKANFVERTEKRPDSSISGTLYYYYQAANPRNSRLRMEYSIPQVATAVGSHPTESKVVNLYNYTEDAMYSMCTKNCTGIKLHDLADPWYYDANYYNATADEESGYHWYERGNFTPVEGLNAQVSRILMSGDTSASANVKKIELRDGRVLELSERQMTNVDFNTYFEKDPNLGCPKATCPIYADLIFVLDNSGSVVDEDWRRGCNFVKKVMEEFTFGDDAVEAAIIQFNAPADNGGCNGKYCSKDKYWGAPSRCSADYIWGTAGYKCNRWGCWWDSNAASLAFPGRDTASVLGGEAKLTSSLQSLESAADAARPDAYGNTCQGYGLQLAMQLLDESHRSKYGKKPQPIVIAITDGQDLCPNTTRQRAEELKNKTTYNAFLIEIGVGLEHVCDDYDVNYLKSIASDLGTIHEKAYYDVENYGAIHEIADKLFRPLCDLGDNECGASCQGFCGCGKCFCPACDDTDSNCFSYECDSNEYASDGCERVDKKCEEGDICTIYSCQKENGKCVGEPNTTSPKYKELEEKQYFKNGCQRLVCDVSMTATDGWELRYDDNYCQDKYGKDDRCLNYSCSRGETADYDDGCVLVTNYTKLKEDELRNASKLYDGTHGCYIPVCNKATGETSEEVYCPEFDDRSRKCYSVTCENENGEGFQCKAKEINKNPDTKCYEYICNAETGWERNVTWNATSCKAKFEEETSGSTDCMIVKCIDDIGCSMTPKPKEVCQSSCSDDDDNNCTLYAQSLSDDARCVAGGCSVVKIEDDNTKPVCILEEPVNCIESMREQIDRMNTNDNKHCMRAVCRDDGQCDTENMPYPQDDPRTDNACMEWMCTPGEDGWHWEYTETTEGKRCHTDACIDRVCDPDRGCNETNKCTAFSNDCFKLTCETGEDGVKKCVNTSLLIETNCTFEKCEDGKKVIQQNVENYCEKNLCKNALCVFFDEFKNTSECTYSDVPDPKPDKCNPGTCDPETGEWKYKPLCDDGLYCTNDRCWKGECRHPEVQCDLELNMDGYPCFQPRCKEGEGKHKCVRKLIPNAYIDICGRCITSKDENETSSESSSSSGSGAEVDATTECTGAPPKPVITEGLAAAAIALIIIGAIVVGAALTASTVVGTKTLIDRAKGANNQSAHSNPLFEENETELANPTYAGEA